MPYFRLRRDAQSWFKYLMPEFKVQFDAYYFCLMAGLAARKRENLNDAIDLTDGFPGPYRDKGRLIVSLFLSRELERLGVALNERAALHRIIRERVASSDPSHLSEEGMSEMNRYASGGYEVLAAYFEESPRSIETFLPMYKAFINTHATSIVE